MPIGWRLCRDEYALTPLDGQGAEKYGGRWNHPGCPMLYVSSTLSLAALELFVHLDPDLAPVDLAAIELSIPDDVSFDKRTVKDLPKNWRNIPAPAGLADRGTQWARDQRTLFVIVPSAVTPGESNLLINPLHSEIERVTYRVEPFRFDPRMWKRS